MSEIDTIGKEYEEEVDDKNASYENIKSDISIVWDRFEDSAVEYEQNIEWYKGNPWTDDEIAEHIRQNRIPYSFNIIKMLINHLKGVQQQTRLDTIAVPREKDDDGRSEILTYLIKWSEQLNDLSYVETRVFEDGLLNGVGCASLSWKLSDLLKGYPYIKYEDPRTLFWDLDSKEIDLSDCRWMAKVQEMTRIDAIEIFPEYAETIRNVGNVRTINVVGGDNKRIAFRNKYYNSGTRNPGREIIQVIDYYEKYIKYTYTIVDDISEVSIVFDDEKDAESYYNGLLDQYAADGKNIIAADGTQLVTKVVSTSTAIKQKIVIGDEIVSDKWTALPMYPFYVYFANYIDGDWWGEVRDIKHQNRLINRAWSQIDYQMSVSAKSAYTVIPALLADGFTMADLAMEMSKTGALIRVRNHGAVNPLQSPPINPELFQCINWAEQFAKDQIGGNSFLGLQETAAESGKAVEARVAQGEVGRLPLFDNLRHWRKNITLGMVWYFQNIMSASEIKKVLGRSGIRYMDIDEGILDTIREIEVDITIDEVSRSESLKARTLSQMVDLFNKCPNISDEIKVQMILPLTQIPQTEQEELRNILEFSKTYSQQQMQQQKQQKLQESVDDSMVKRMLKEQAERKELLESQSGDIDKQMNDIESQMKQLEDAKMKLRQKQAEQQSQQPVQQNQTIQ